MDENKMIIYSNSDIELSESEETPDCLDIKFLICDFNPNLNGVRVDREFIEDWMDTIKIKPIVGKIAKIPFRKNEDFTSHQAKKVTKKDENGNIYTVKELNTDAFGTFYDVDIEEIDGEEVLCAKGKIWKRFEKAVEILQRKIDNGEKIASSWEVNILDKEFITIDGKVVKNIKKGNFLGHCILGYSEKTGQKVYGAYDSSEVLECAEVDEESFEYQLSEAILKDIENLNKEEKGGQVMSKENNEKDNVETSSLTLDDIRKSVREAVWNDENFGYCYDVWQVYPLENRAIAKVYGEDKLDEDFVEISYSINENDGVVTIGEVKEVKMTFVTKTVYDEEIAKLTVAKENIEKDLAQCKKDKENAEKENEDSQCKKDKEISELKVQLSEKETELSSKISSIVDLGKNIAEKETLIAEKDKELEAKDTEISELKPFKEQIDEINKEKEEAELSEKRETFKNEYVNMKLISDEDLEVSEVKSAIENMDSKAMESFIAQKVIANAKAGLAIATETEVSEVDNKNDVPNAEMNLNSAKSLNVDEDAFRKAFKR